MELKTGVREAFETSLIYKFMVGSHLTSKHVEDNQSCHSCIKVIVSAALSTGNNFSFYYVTKQL